MTYSEQGTVDQIRKQNSKEIDNLTKTFNDHEKAV